LSYRHSASFDF